MFPLAYGWWVILGGIIIAFFLIKIILWSIRTSKKKYALNTLKNIDTNSPVDAALKMSELLRRICNVKYKKASALYGKEWIDFLNEKSSLKISGDTANLLIYAPFMDITNKTYKPETASELKDFCKNWIGANL
jgi:hypothetical protein